MWGALFFESRKAQCVFRFVTMHWLLLTYILKRSAAKCVRGWIMRLCECVHAARKSECTPICFYRYVGTPGLCLLREIRRTNTRIDFPIVYVSSRGIYAERKGSFRLLFSVAVTEANSGRHFRMFHERSRKISYILVYNINFYRESF